MPSFYKFNISFPEDTPIYYSFDDVFVPIDFFNAGNLFSWGINESGQLALNDSTLRNSPNKTYYGFDDWKKISSGSNFSLGIRSGYLVTWGNGSNGQLGTGSNNSSNIPIILSSQGSEWMEISSGYDHAGAIRSDGSLWMWGNNYNYQLSAANQTIYNTPNQVVSSQFVSTLWAKISCGNGFSLGIRKDNDNSLWGWGSNQYGQLGRSDASSFASPIAATNNYSNNSSSIANSLLGAASLTSSTTPTFGSSDDGYWIISLPWTIIYNETSYSTVYVGTNSYITFGAGQIGFSNLSVSNPAVNKIMIQAADNSAQRIYFGTEGSTPNRTYRIRFEGTADLGGTLGSPNMVWEAIFYENNRRQIDIQIGSMARSNGVNGACSSSTLLTTGDIGTAKSGTRLFSILSANWMSISCGDSHSIGILKNGSLQASGRNNYGQLGLGDTNNRNSWFTISSNLSWKQVSCGFDHSAAIKTDGTLWTWGRNNNGQLGLGDIDDRMIPVQIGIGINWKQVSCGKSSTVAVKTDGSLWVWGLNDQNQLGLGDGLNSIINTPQQIGIDYNWRFASVGYSNFYGIKYQNDYF